jgi:large subunit ribosomal protein L1
MKSKKQQEFLKSYGKSKTYSIEEALEILEKFPKPKFDETMEIHISTFIDPKKSDQQIRNAVVLPHGTGKTLKIAAFTESQEKEAKEAKADIIGGEKLIEEIKKKEVIDFDIAVATPEIMPKLAQIAKILGPKGLMPNAKTQTIGPKIKTMIEELKKGKTSFKNDDSGNIHQIIGKRSYEKEQLIENYKTLMEEINKSKPEGIKGRLIRTISLSSTMSPSIKVKA